MSWALITGASSGIGRATAEKLAGDGYNLILMARREERLRELRKSLGVEVVLAVVDITKPTEVEAFAAAHARELAQTDVLVNNAGLAKGTEKLFEAKTSDWDTMIDTNVKGLLYVTRAVIPHMMKNNRGHIVNLGSVAGRWVYPGGAVYCASKFAVRALSEGLRLDVMGTSLRVTNIEPGMVETEFSEVRLESAERAKAVYRGMKPLTATDIAETILWCVQRPPHVNIQELVIFPTDQAAIQHVHRRDSEKPV
jgi:3-hydroxy acid dehydrogenase/malonic semialdehyde reductase